VNAAILILGFVTAERLLELWVSRRNTQRLLQQGAQEHAPGHYPLIVLLHASWLLGLWILAWDNSVSYLWVGIFAGLQVLRLWVLATLGARWTTRIIVLPQAPLISAGPYRFFPHPNYLVVIGEFAVLPLVFGLPWFALIFSVLNACVLSIRIRAENRALRG
jgi:methyltransferase